MCSTEANLSSLKCDETKPECSACKRRAIQCSYVLAASTPTAAAVALPTPPAGGLTVDSPIAVVHRDLAVTPEASPSDDASLDLNMNQLELLHNYSTATCYTLSRNPLLQTIWRISVPQVGLTSTFAMRAIMAMSALHLAHYKPAHKASYVAIANHHHELALRAVTGTLPNITKDNCEALYVFAALTCLISCAKPRKPGDFLLVGNRGISEWLQLFRGTRFIIDHADSVLRAGPLGPMFSIGHRRMQLREAAAIKNEDQLLDLRRLIDQQTNLSQETQNIYVEAINELSKSFAMSSELGPQGCESADVFVWVFRISDEYLALLSKRSPEAMVIFAYFCVVLKELEWAWWMQGWSSHLVSGIYHALNHEYRIWIRWPIEQIGFVPT